MNIAIKVILICVICLNIYVGQYNEPSPKIRSPNRGKHWQSGRITVSADLVFRRKIWGAWDNGIPPRSTPEIAWSRRIGGSSWIEHILSCSVKPGTHHAIFVFCWTQRRRKDDCRMVCAHQRRSSSVDFTNATVVEPIRKTNRSNNCCMVCAGQRHLSHQPTGHRPITVKHFPDA